jgi:hypothetical protein
MNLMLGKAFAIQTIATLLTFLGAGGIYIPETLAQEIPKAECVSAYGQTKCGYSCIAAYGDIKCANWAGGACKAAYGDIICGPPAPPNWIDAYSNRSNLNHSRAGVRGAWAVTSNGWQGILRMNGSVGNLVLISGSTIVEQRVVLNQNPNGGYVLNGQVLTWHNLNTKYYADNIYLQKFSRSFSARNCDNNQNCNTVTLTYLGN